MIERVVEEHPAAVEQRQGSGERHGPQAPGLAAGQRHPGQGVGPHGRQVGDSREPQRGSQVIGPVGGTTRRARGRWRSPRRAAQLGR